MALQVLWSWKHAGIQWKSGLMYSFAYNGWQHDPHPLILVINAIKGIHPKTGNQHRYMQGINLNYVPRASRQVFVNHWMDAYNKSKGDMKITWQIIKVQYPYIASFIRRYFMIPAYYISDAKAIPADQVQKAVIKSYLKDYSAWVMRKTATALRQFHMYGAKKKKRR